MSLPTNNIYWRDIQAGAVVRDAGSVFVVTQDGKEAVAYWAGLDQPYAQLWLQRMTSKPHVTIPDLHKRNHKR